MKPQAFRTEDAFSAWLEKNGTTERELMLRLYKTHARDKGIGYTEALDVALCWGWIDGVRRALDADSFVQRFTPRKADSYWSAVNMKKYAALERAGRIRPPGAAAYARRPADAGSRYSTERGETVELGAALEKRFRRERAAWAWFQKVAPGYRRKTLHWVMSAKQEATREKRLAVVIECAAAGRLIPMLARAAAAPAPAPTARGSRGPRGRSGAPARRSR